jgi:hypothetical protein
MKKLILICAMGSSIAFGQNFEWAKNIGSSGDDRGNVIKTDVSGNIIVAGAFSGTADFDTGSGTTTLTSVGDLDLFVAKYDAAGDLLWVEGDGAIYDDFVVDMVVDNSGNIYITGYGELNTAGSQRAMYVVKLDANGSEVWSNTFTSTSSNIGGYALSLDAIGNVFVGGNFNGTVDFDPSSGTYDLTTTGIVSLTDAYILKLDNGGNLSWVQQFACSAANANILSMTIDGSGNVYTTGQYWNSLDCDPGAGTAILGHSGNGDMFISKLDVNGAYVWAKKMGASESEYGLSIAVDASENVYTTGYFAGTVDFDPGSGTEELTSLGERDAFVLKLDMAGDYVWVKSMGSTSANDVGSELVVDGSGNVYTMGYFEGNVDFDPGVGVTNNSSAGAKDAFLQKLNSDGEFVWAHQFGSTGDDQGVSLTLDASDNIFIAGHFYETVDFDFSAGDNELTSNGDRDLFFAKWSQPIIGIGEQTNTDFVNVYPNPSTGVFHFTEKLIKVSVYNLNGKLIKTFSQTNSIDLSQLDKGMYVVEMKSDKSTKTDRLIIK